jgi:hypothetical protein
MYSNSSKLAKNWVTEVHAFLVLLLSCTMMEHIIRTIGCCVASIDDLVVDKLSSFLVELHGYQQVT